MLKHGAVPSCPFRGNATTNVPTKNLYQHLVVSRLESHRQNTPTSPETPCFDLLHPVSSSSDCCLL